MVEGLVMPEYLAFNEADRAAVYRVMGARRDVRRGFIDRPLPDDVLQRLLAAAHSAPSVGLMQPSRFIVIRDLAIRTAVHQIFTEANQKAAETYQGEQREQYDTLKLEGILEAPQSLCVVCDTQNKRGHKLGRHTMPETAAYSTVCAIQNLWLAARTEGIGVGWVSILDPVRLRTLLHIPDHILLIAYLCLGFVDHFAAEPELERAGWEKRVPVQTAVCYDLYNEDNKS
ncbi:5,6-dimethylbenzimidazole synthase [Granulicella sp. 5B5]|uniref:5,6-dimethylbenzimidazole synthase n=1 Tax=Granulicella sp. 5B5 TaxID=1617967 RepID=UPI0015F73A72|nr:5,6-dimethylbenzimidazole synthase [Granulicella sp. 5B5]QMV17316.1 5,6-dimethylbenzimidazole synthase [Granulicella sp. 5B5]